MQNCSLSLALAWPQLQGRDLDPAKLLLDCLKTGGAWGNVAAVTNYGPAPCSNFADYAGPFTEGAVIHSPDVWAVLRNFGATVTIA